MTNFLTMADTIVGNIDLHCELQSERDYFWAIALDLDAKIVADWEMFAKPPLLYFEEIHQIISDFDDFRGGAYDADRVEAFVAGQVWIDKMQSDRVLNREFLPYLQISPLARRIVGRAMN
jgi:hypothetical protein